MTAPCGRRSTPRSPSARSSTDLPVRVALADLACVALAASDDRVRHDALRALVTRLAVTHSPADLAFAAVLSPASRHVETWLRWLPHTGRRIDGLAPVAVGAGEGTALLHQAVVDASFAGDLVILVDEAAGVPTRAVEALVAQASLAPPAPRDHATAGATTRPRVHVLWFGTAATSAPPSSGAVLTVDGEPCVALGDRGGVTPLTEVDPLDLATTWHIARTLNACRDDAALVPPESAMPDVVRLTDLGGDLRDPSDTDGVLARWSASRGLRAQLGVGADGVVTIDLREDGPHGLVAGTTGLGQERAAADPDLLARGQQPAEPDHLPAGRLQGRRRLPASAPTCPTRVGYITDLTPGPGPARPGLPARRAHRTASTCSREYGAKDLVALERTHPDVAPPEPAHLRRRVRRADRRGARVRRRHGQHRAAGTVPRHAPAPGHPAPGRGRHRRRSGPTPTCGSPCGSPPRTTPATSSTAPTRPSSPGARPGRAWMRRTGHGTDELVQVA